MLGSLALGPGRPRTRGRPATRAGYLYTVIGVDEAVLPEVSVAAAEMEWAPFVRFFVFQVTLPEQDAVPPQDTVPTTLPSP